jgi:hypothetical protein
MTASELMSRNLVSISESATLEEAIAFLTDSVYSPAASSSRSGRKGDTTRPRRSSSVSRLSRTRASPHRIEARVEVGRISNPSVRSDGIPIRPPPAQKGGASMNERQVTFPQLALIAGTRVVLGVGLGLLLAGQLSAEHRRAVGWSLVAVGALTTIPLAAQVLGQKQSSPSPDLPVRENPVSQYVTSS